MLLPQPAGETKRRLEAVVPEFGSTANPCDVTGQVLNNPESFPNCVAAFLEDPDYAALVFPVVMLMQMMSAGAMGGGISSAVARALGAGRRADAEALVLHALAISVAFVLVFILAMTDFGNPEGFNTTSSTAPVTVSPTT